MKLLYTVRSLVLGVGILLGGFFFIHSQFAQAAGEPVVVNDTVGSITQTSATPIGIVTDEGVAPVIGIWIEYGTTNSYGAEVQRYNLNELTLPGSFDVPLTGLTCGTTYHYRFRVRNNGLLDGYSADATFTTSDCDGEPLPFAGGAGTELDPYQIATCSQLQAINLDLDAHYIQTGDIDCSETEFWNLNLDEWVDGDTDNGLIPDQYDVLIYGEGNTPPTPTVVNNGYKGFEPIGQNDALSIDGPGFTGVFDGAGHTISDIWIFRKSEPLVGLFGFATGATIKNITLAGARIVGQQNTGAFVGSGSGVILDQVTNTNGMVRAYLSYRGGGIAGWLRNNSTLENASVVGGTVHGSGNVIGGLVGLLTDSVVTDSDASAAVDGGEYIGGAFGDIADSQVSRVQATGNVVSNLLENGPEDNRIWIAKSGYYAGGFAGRIGSSTITDSSATGSVASEGYYAGGFAGLIDGVSAISTSYATGSVSSTASQVGGFVGQAYGTVTFTGAYATGDVTGIQNVGGFAGTAYCGVSFIRAYATGDVTATENNAGGFVGSDGCEGPGATYSEVSASGSVTGGDRVGGFVGESYVSDFTDTYASGSVVGADSVGGFGGYMYQPKILHAYARGSVTGDTNVGGFIGVHYIGTDDRIITSAFFDTVTSGLSSACGDGDCSGVTGLVSIAMKTQNTYTDEGWDFDSIWQIDAGENNGYPYFDWQTPPSTEYVLETLSATTITQTAAVLRGQVVSGDFMPGALGFAVSPTVFDAVSGAPWLIGPVDDFGTTPDGEGVFSLDLNEFINDGNNYLEISGFTCGTTYYYMAIGFVGFGVPPVTADNVLTFTTLACDEQPEPQPQTPAAPGAVALFVLLNSANQNLSASSGQPQSSLSVRDLSPVLPSAPKSGENPQQQNPVCSEALYPKKTIRRGANNDPAEVRLLQRHLNTYEGAQLPVTGVYSQQDERAVIAWQEKYAPEILAPWGITRGTGLVLRTSLQKFRSLFLAQCQQQDASQKSALVNGQRNLEVGMEGEDVKRLQQELIQYNAGVRAQALARSGATGYFGEITRAALAEYQRAVGITPANGLYGPKTRAQLDVL